MGDADVWYWFSCNSNYRLFKKETSVVSIVFLKVLISRSRGKNMTDYFEYNSSLKKKFSVLCIEVYITSYVFQVDSSQRKIGISFEFLTTAYGWNVCSLQSIWNQNIHLIIILEKELTFIDLLAFTLLFRNMQSEPRIWRWENVIPNHETDLFTR